MENYYNLLVNFTRQKIQSLEILSDSSFRFQIEGNNGNYFSIVQFDEQANHIFCYSSPQLKVAQDKRLAIAELIIRFNYRLSTGHIDLDWDNCVVQSKTYTYPYGVLVDVAIWDLLIYRNLQLLEFVMPAIEMVNAGAFTVEEAFKHTVK